MPPVRTLTLGIGAVILLSGCKKSSSTEAEFVACSEAIQVGETKSGTLSGSGWLERHYRLDLPADKSVRVGLTSSAFDPIARIQSSAGLNTITNTRENTPTGSSIVSANLKAGTYCILVATGEYGKGGSFSLIVYR